MKPSCALLGWSHAHDDACKTGSPLPAMSKIAWALRKGEAMTKTEKEEAVATVTVIKTAARTTVGNRVVFPPTRR